LGWFIVTYAFDLPGMFKMANRGALERIGIANADLRAIAVKNLRTQLPKIGTTDEQPVNRIVTGENLEACTLLASSFWAGLSADTKGELVVVAPSRDVVLFCSSESAEAVSTLRKTAREVLAAESVHGLSETLLTWRENQWQPFEP
jgi:uncharacterized protein YtpQ (UPF0354 family)